MLPGQFSENATRREKSRRDPAKSIFETVLGRWWCLKNFVENVGSGNLAECQRGRAPFTEARWARSKGRADVVNLAECQRCPKSGALFPKGIRRRERRNAHRHVNLAECQSGSKSGANRRPNRGTNRRTKIPKKRALWYSRRTLSETSVPHLVVFLKYFDKVSLSPNGPVCDVYYYTSPPLRGRGKRAAPLPSTLRDSRSRARRLE